jgi:putative endonuclease
MYYIYFLYSEAADKYYVGHSQDPWKRLEQHLSNSGDKYTGSYDDWKLMAVFEVSSIRGEADKIEKFIKRQKSRALLKKMLDPEFKGKGVLAPLVRVRMCGINHSRKFGTGSSRKCGRGAKAITFIC